MDQKRDYYEILGVSKSAGADELKKAYRDLALKFIPTEIRATRNAENKFKEITEAYEVLTDPKKKEIYDQYGHAGFGPAGVDWKQDFGRVRTDFSDIFGDLFSSFFSESFETGGGRGSGRQRGSHLETSTSISLKEAASGTERFINASVLEQCEVCAGTGSKSRTGRITCLQCQGRGQVQYNQGFLTFAQTCPRCKGTGKVVSDPCSNCSGSGVARRMHKIQVKIPAGIESGTTLRIKGQGNAGPAGTPRGDLYVTVYVEPDAFFERRDSDLYCQVPVTVISAIVGTEIEVPTLTGKVKLKIPPGTQNGTVFRLRNMGLPRISGYGKGNLLVVVKIEIPHSFGREERRLLEELQKLENPRNYPEVQKFKEHF